MNNPILAQSRPEPLRFLVFSASLRIDSLNTRSAKLAALVIKKNGGKVDFANMSEFDCPSFNQDSKLNGFHPSGAEEFRKRLLVNDAFIIASPEYNGSIPGFLKNAIDWVSRFSSATLQRPQCFTYVSFSFNGWRQPRPMVFENTFRTSWRKVFPNMFSLATAHKAFTSEGNIADVILAKRFEDNIVAFMNHVEAAKNYPCMKKAWVEFLGEKPDPVIERVE